MLRRRLLEAPANEWPEIIIRIDDVAAADSAATHEPPPKTGDPGRILHIGGAGDKPRQLGSDDLEIDVRVRMERVPTGIAHLLDQDQHPLVTATVVNRGDDPVRLECSCVVEGYSSESRWSDVVAGRRRSKGLAPINLLPTFFPERVATIRDITRATLQVAVQVHDDDKDTWHTRRSHPIWLLPRSSAFRAIIDPAKPGQVIDIARYLCAYVTPNSPLIMRVLRRAVEHHSVRAFHGYQGSASDVRLQVKAIYEALRERDIAYVNSVTVYGHHLGEIVQRVRLPRESLRRRSANCLDGVVLFASLLEAASLKPVLVLLNRHAVVGWATAADSSAFEFVETTALTNKSFEDAMALGREQASSKHACLVSVANARQDGIWPME